MSESSASVADAGLGDWLLLNTSPGAGGAVLDAAGKPLNPLTTFHFIDAYNGKDIVFAGGQKWFDNPTNWVWTVNKASSKTDINNVLLHVTRDDPPTLLIHGDKDTLVKLDNSQKILEAFGKTGVKSELIVIEGAGHGFKGDENVCATKAMIEWFDKYLAKKTS